MKLLILTPIFPPEIGGPASYSSMLLKIFKSNTNVITFGSTGSDNPQVQVVSTKGNIIFRQAKLFLAVLEKCYVSDILYIQEPAVVGLAGVIVGKLLRKKIITKYVGDPSWEKTRSIKNTEILLDTHLSKISTKISPLFLITGVVLHLSNKIIAPSEYLSKVLQNHYYLPNKKVSVIFNAVELGKQSTAKRENSIIVVGRLVSWKNIDLIIEALKNVSDHTLNLKIVGAGPEEKKLKALAKKLNLEKRVIFMGSLPKDETLKIIAKSKALVLFSDYEGMPHVVLEAFSQGTLVIASNIPGTNEVVIDGKTGVLVKSKSVSDLSDKLNLLAKNNLPIKEMIKNAKKLLQKKHTWKEHINKLKNEIF